MQYFKCQRHLVLRKELVEACLSGSTQKSLVVERAGAEAITLFISTWVVVKIMVPCWVP